MRFMSWVIVGLLLFPAARLRSAAADDPPQVKHEAPKEQEKPARIANKTLTKERLIAAVNAFADRFFDAGVKLVFSREYSFSDSRPLTEQLAIEVSRRALKADVLARSSSG